MFNLFKKKRVPREVFIPEENIVELLRLFDEWHGIETYGDASAKYAFWKRAEEICPELKKGTWEAKMKNGTHPFFLERL